MSNVTLFKTYETDIFFGDRNYSIDSPNFNIIV